MTPRRGELCLSLRMGGEQSLGSDATHDFTCDAPDDGLRSDEALMSQRHVAPGGLLRNVFERMLLFFVCFFFCPYPLVKTNVTHAASVGINKIKLKPHRSRFSANAPF